MGTFLNFACPGVYIEQNAPRAVRSKARVWTERPARGAFNYSCAPFADYPVRVRIFRAWQSSRLGQNAFSPSGREDPHYLKTLSKPLI